MTHKVSVRMSNSTDSPRIAEIYLASRKMFLPFAQLAHSDERIYQWVLETLIPSGHLFVAEQKNIIIGMMALSKNGGIGWIDQLYLSPNYTGRGIGSLLIQFAKERLGSPIRLYSFQRNDDARRFYEKHGFQALALRDGSENEEKCPDILYEWRVVAT